MKHYSLNKEFHLISWKRGGGGCSGLLLDRRSSSGPTCNDGDKDASTRCEISVGLTAFTVTAIPTISGGIRCIGTTTHYSSTEQCTLDIYSTSIATTEHVIRDTYCSSFNHVTLC